MKLIKLSFTSKKKWDAVKKTLDTDCINTTWEHGRLPKPPTDDNGEWGIYDDYAVDLLVCDTLDTSKLDKYMIRERDKYIFNIA